MACLEVYRRVLNTPDTDAICRLFLETVLPTNRTHDFFVDWGKVAKNVERFKFEIAILDTICGSNHVEADLKEALRREPQITTVLPLIIAVRDMRLEVLENLHIKRYDFGARERLSEEEINDTLDFCRKTGIVALFQSLRVRSLRDYLLGVEVGLDTNARKNRSGTWMERIVERQIVIDAQKHPEARIVRQRRFSSLADEGLAIPRNLRNRMFDLAYLDGPCRINIETNFYVEAGSKPQEIIDSYIDRQRQLQEAGWHFILITDGKGWIGGENQLRRGVQDLDFVANLNFVRAGLVQAAIEHYYG